MSEKLIALFKLAAKHLNNGAAMSSSAMSCFTDALECKNETHAMAWLVRSLDYSVGIFHADRMQARIVFDSVFYRAA